MLDFLNDESLNELNNNELKAWFNGLDGVNEDFINFLDEVDLSGNIIEQYQQHLIDTGQATSTFTALTKKAGSILKSFSAALGSMAIMWFIGEGVSLVVKVIQDLTSANEKYIESQQKIVDKTNKQIAEYDSEIENLTTLQEKLVEAKNNKEKLANIQNDLNDAIGQTPGLLNGEADSWEIANQRITDRIALLQKLREEELTKNIQAIKNIYNNQEVDNDWGTDRKLIDYFDYRYFLLLGGKDLYDSLYEEYISKIGTDDEQSFAEILSDRFSLQSLANNPFLDRLPNSEEIQTYLDTQYNTIAPLFTDYISNLDSILPKESLYSILKQLVYINPDDAEAVEKQFKIFINRLQNSNLEETYNKFLKSLNDDSLDSDALYEELKDIITTLSEEYPVAKQSLDSFFSTVGTTVSNVGEIASDTKKSFIEALKSSSYYSNYLEKFQTLAESGTLSSDLLSSTEEYSKLLNDLGFSADEACNSLKQFFGELDYGSMMDGLQDSLNAIINAQLELSNNGKLSYDTTKNLLSVYPELINQLKAVEGGYITTDAALQDLIDTKLANYKINTNELIDSANKIITSLGGEAIAYNLTTEEIKKQIRAQIALILSKQNKDKLSDRRTPLETASILNNRPTYSELTGSNPFQNLHNDIYSSQIDELQNILDFIDTSDKNFQNALELYEKLKESINENYSNSYSYSSASDTTDYWKQEFDDQLSLLKHQLSMNQITAAKYYNELDKLNNKYFANNAKYLSEYRQYEEEVYNGLISLQDNALNSIHNLIDLREDMIKDMKQKEIDAIEEIITAEKNKLDAINESIDARKKAIELLRDEKDHEKEMSEKNKTISDLQIKLEALKYDNSASAQKKRRELEEELANARTELADYIADYEYDKALEALDNEADLAEKQYKQQEENLQNQIDAIEAYLDDEKQLMQDAINDINGMNNSLFEDMKNWAYETTGEVWEVVEAWKEAKEALEMYNAVNKVSEIHETLHNNSQNGVATAIGATSSMGGKTISNSTSSANSNSQTGSNSSSGYKAVHTIVKNDTLWTLAQKYYGDGAKWTKIQKANSDVDPYKLQIGKKLYIPYRKGIKKVPRNQLALTDEAGDELTLHANEKGNLQMLTKGSSVIPADITENLVKWGKVAPDLFMQNLQPFISPMIIHQFTPKEASPTVNIGDININGNIGSLTKSDLNEFRKDIVNDVYDSMQKNRVKSGRY